MTSLSNRQTPPIRIEGILPSLDNLHIVISCNFKYLAVSLVVIICAKIDSPVDRVNYVSLLTPGKGGSFRKRKPFHPKGLQVAVGLPLVKICFARTVR